MTSGTMVKTLSPIRNAAGALIEPGTEVMVLGVTSSTDPVVYLLETLENPEFEQEEFFCFAEHVELIERVA
ncbi:MAG: hypothetical protein KAT62_00610 [Desulfuromonadales bacterium]|nr:hypothetical protein [Desulfuromonadales bacterium]